MGKNSNAHVGTARHEEEIAREREREAKAALKRARREKHLAATGGASAVPVAMDDGAPSGSGESGGGADVLHDGAVAAAVAGVLAARRTAGGHARLSSLGKRKHAMPGLHRAGISKAGRSSEEKRRAKEIVRVSLTGGKKKGPRKPSALMKRTLKKMAKRREEEMGVEPNAGDFKRRSCRI